MSEIDFYIQQMYQEAEEILENFVRNNKPIEIPTDEFLSMFVWYFDTMDYKIGEKPKVSFNIRLKNVDEIKNDIDRKIKHEEKMRLMQLLDDIDSDVI